jgi:hypothetical protein
MRKIISTLCATVLAASVGVVGAVPATATPVNVLQMQPVNASDVVQIDNQWRKKGHGDRSSHRGFHRHNDQTWYNGHKGYKHQRPGYRSYNGWWFPEGAFIAGAIITDAMDQDDGSAHVRWCHNRYRSYRAWDNSWQPYKGPRRQCISPYM